MHSKIFPIRDFCNTCGNVSRRCRSGKRNTSSSNTYM